MGTLLPVAIALAALVLTYFTCIRPMRRGHCVMTTGRQEPAEDPAVLKEIAQLRTEIGALRGDTGVQASPGQNPTI